MTAAAPYSWPWFGLAAAAAILVLLFRRAPRWRDPAWLAWLGVAIYMLHQFEEHGVDAMGDSYAFRGFFCRALGFADPAPDACPVPHGFLTAVNVGTVWISSLLGALAGRRNPAVALSAVGIPLLNTPAHVLPAILSGSYNPGLLTALCLFIPYCAWAIRSALGSGLITRAQAVGIAAGGVAAHVVLMGSLQLFLRDMIGEPTLVVAQIVNALVPVATVLAVGQWGAASQVKS